MKVLFISRAYPPIIGGIENQNYELSVWLPKYTETKTIANRHGKLFLPVFIPCTILRALFLMRHYDVLLLGDGVLGIAGFILKRFYPKKPVVSIVHGLDLTFKNTLYQNLWVKKFLPALDALIAVGKETVSIGIALGIPKEKFVFIPNGVDTEKFATPHKREELEHLLGRSLTGKYIILTSGRLAKRKGVAWFIRNVLPKLPDTVIYVVAGEGIDKKNIEQAIQETHSSKQVYLLGHVSDETRNILLKTCDIFVQPNIRVPGDVEGFGISVIEASACGCPVVVANLEGLKDAIIQNENGILVESENAQDFQETILRLLTDETARHALGERAITYTKTHYHWNIIARLYIETLRTLLK